MPVSIALPTGATQQGGLKTVDGDEWLLQLIMSAVSANDSDNPWNLIDINPGEEIVFSINDQMSAGRASQSIRDLFKSLEQQNFAKLIRLKVAPSDTVAEEMNAFIKYLNIESDSEVEIDIPLS